MAWSAPRKIRNCDVDINRRLRTSSLFTFLQEASISHTEELGAGRKVTLDRDLLWVVTLQRVEITRMPEYDDEITIRTWPGTTMHWLFPRYYQIEGSDGRPLIRGSAIWALMNRTTRTMINPEKHQIHIDGEMSGDEIRLPSPPSTMTRDCGGDRVFEFTVPYSLTDMNGHLNNVRYFDLIDDLTDRELLKQGPAVIVSEYMNELRIGETFTVSVVKEENTCLFSGRKVDGRMAFAIKVEY